MSTCIKIIYISTVVLLGREVRTNFHFSNLPEFRLVALLGLETQSSVTLENLFWETFAQLIEL